MPPGEATPAVRTVGVIPARLGSTRLPRKVLRPIAGRPMLAWVYDAARACPQLDAIVIATDSDEVDALCQSNGWPHLRTDPALSSGSDRVHAVALRRPAEIYVNLQADEPLLRPDHLSALLALFADPLVRVTTLKTPCPAESIGDPNTVKVVTDGAGRALYFSRATIPHDRDGQGAQAFKHLGLYGYRAEALHRFHALPPSPLERLERLEQLRLLEHGIPIHVAETPHNTVGVDTEADLATVEALLRARAST